MADSIVLNGVKKSFGGRTVVDIPRLELEAGGRYALIGANGSGKSTLLRLLAGILLPDCGEIRMPEGWRQARGYMPQRPYAYGFSVLKNVRIACHGVPNATEAARSALEAVGLAHLEKAGGGKLSGGESQRMAFARMLVCARPLLLLDEPTSATDIEGSDLVEAALLDYCRRTGCTLLIATHAPAQALRVSAQTILLDRGTIAEQGETRALLKNPQSERGQKFLRHWTIQQEPD